jgi:hypothetical protein
MGLVGRDSPRSHRLRERMQRRVAHGFHFGFVCNGWSGEAKVEIFILRLAPVEGRERDNAHTIITRGGDRRAMATNGRHDCTANKLEEQITPWLEGRLSGG